MWVRIIRERRLYPFAHHRLCVVYRVGSTVPIKRTWGELLIANGDAVEVPTPPRCIETA